MSRKDAAIRLWQVQHNGEMPDEDDAILDNEDLIRKPGQEATRALKLLGTIIDNVERVPNKDKPAVMVRIKELHGMVVNGATKRRSGQAKTKSRATAASRQSQGKLSPHAYGMD